jgi:hypothetical protein
MDIFIRYESDTKDVKTSDFVRAKLTVMASESASTMSILYLLQEAVEQTRMRINENKTGDIVRLNMSSIQI